MRDAGGIDVVVTRGESGARPAVVHAAHAGPSPVTHDLVALGITAVATLVCLATRPWLSIADQAMVYVVAVLAAASRLSRRAALVAVFASVAALDWFFVPPYYTFAFADARYAVTFAVLLATALLVAGFAARERRSAAAARDRERRTAALYAVSRELGGMRDAPGIVAVGARHVRDLHGVDVVGLLPGAGGGLEVVVGDGTPLATSEKERAVARWVFDHGRPAGHGTDTLPAAEGLYLPLVGSAGPLGVLGVALGARAEAPGPSDRQLVETFASQTAVALERAALAAEAERSCVTVETERMRSTLLSTVSHDLRTPLASITGAAGAMLDPGTGLDEATRRELLTTIRDESDRLGRLVSDLLDLTRLEGGALAVKKEWYPLEEVVASAVQRVRPRLEGRAISIELPQEVLLVEVDGVLLEQVVVNLLENAAKHTPAGGPVVVRLTSSPEEVVFEVLDRGPGIPAGEEERIFEKFHRIETGHAVEGAGLGLAVCRAIVRAHGGRITAANRPGGGAVFRVTIPRGADAPSAPEEAADEPPGAPGTPDPAPGGKMLA